MNITVLHLTDLHFSRAKSKDIEIVKKALFADLKSLLSKEIVPTIVIFSGDFIQAGDLGYSQAGNDYETVRNEFIDPLLQLLDLDTNRFFICPGNHDIQRSQVDKNKYMEAGLRSILVNRGAVNDLIDDLEYHSDVLARLNNFERFKNSFSNSFIIRNHGLFSTYSFNEFGKKIGIACINSAWRAYGGSEDYGKLLIGERVIDNCIEDLASCDLRIGVVHHPLEYLEEFERAELKRRIFGAFNIWLRGHTHEPDFDLVQTFNEDRVVVITGGALYVSREYYNGYSVIEFSLTENNGKVYLREYIDRSRKFVPALAYEHNQGIVSFSLSKASTVPLNKNLSLVSQLRNNVLEGINKLVLPITLGTNTRPRELTKIFVEPPLCKTPEYSQKGRVLEAINNDTECIELEEVLKSNNILFLGEKESGKTSLLNYICVRFLDLQSGEARIPLVINFQTLPKGKDRILKALLRYLADNLVEFALEQSLQEGNCLILIDDLDLRDVKSLTDLRMFAQNYAKNRFIFTADESLLAGGDLTELPSLGVDYEQFYIHSFGMDQIKTLIDKWFESTLTSSQVDELTDNLILNLSAINIPSTPLTVSLLLFIIEQQAEFVPINKASLLEKFIEILLEKTIPTERDLSGIDYRNNEHFLSYIAYYMVHTNNFKPTSDVFREAAQEYFEGRGLPLPMGVASFIENLISKGILIDDGESIFFRFSCFAEFFIAKYMIEDREFYEHILSEELYLTFSHEIEYMTGLQRNNKDLVELLHDRTKRAYEKFLKELNFEVTLENFDKITTTESIFDSLSETEKRLLEDLWGEDASEGDDETNDEELNEFDTYLTARKKQEIIKSSYEDYRTFGASGS